jgi:Mlc titration factor MtfA (ptsG expression regulator)
MIGLLKRRCRRKLASGPFPEAWRQIIRERFPLYARLCEADQKELESHILDEKGFEGCEGLVINDEIRVSIAAQACLLLLHRPGDYYSQLRSILVYPSTYFAQSTHHAPAGVIHEQHQALLGQSWQHGAVLLAWDSVQAGAANPFDGQNVVFHEFAHQLDQEDGRADGAPLLAQREPFRMRIAQYSSWAKIMAAEYDLLCKTVNRGKKTVLDAYGASNPAEFFAVATECFFEKPKQLLQKHPALYSELAKLPSESCRMADQPIEHVLK